jgi:glycosyltransferase involved in cell wall biosynthesis
LTKLLGVIATMDPRNGGPPSAGRNIWVAAARAGLSVSAAFGHDNPISAGETVRIEDLIAQGIEVHAFPLSGSGGGLAGRWGISLALALWLCRRAGDFDVIQVHGAWAFSTCAAVFAGRLHRRPVVLFPDESLTRFDRAKTGFPLKRTLKKWIRRLLLGATAEIVFSSPLEQSDSIDPGEASRGAVLFHPVLDERTTVFRERPLPQEEGLKVGYLGRLHEKKNVEILLDCLALDPSLRLIVAGDGDPGYRDTLKARAESQGIAARVTWLGFIDAAERPDFFAGIDILAMPSAYECFGMSAAEAMCSGVPVIVAERTGVAGLVERHAAGRVIAPDPGELLAALRDLRQNPALLHDYGQAARRLAENELSLGRYGKRLAALHRGLLRESVANHA